MLSELSGIQEIKEALTVIKFELQRPRLDEQTRRPMKKMFDTIVHASSVNVPSVPTWFIPRSDLDYDTRPFARGSFGAVHRGTWGSGAKVVVKRLLLKDAESSTGAMSQFLKEIDLWYTLHHPNVVKLFGACHVSSPPLIVCEDATNGNLADFLASSDGGIRHMWRLLLEVALGLEYLHRNQVVHGDLNLNNLLVGTDGAARVADFGLSIVGSTGSSFSATDGSGGGLRWRAPECLKQRPTFESDVYSLAICMIEAVSGEPPYSLEDDVTVQKLVLSGQLPTRPTQMSDEAWKLVVSMTTFDPSKRLRLTDAISRVKLLAENDCENATWSPGNTTHEAEKPDQHTQPSRGNEKTDTYAESYPLSEETGSDGAVDVRSVELTIVPASNTNQHFLKEIIHLNSRLTMRELMVSSLENGSPQEKYAALKWLYRKATDEAESQHIKQAGGHQLAFKCLQDPSLAVYHHVYGFGVLYRMYIAHAISSTDFKVVEEKVCTLRVYKEAELKEMLFPRNEGEAAEKVALIQKWESYMKDSSPFIPALVTMLRTGNVEEVKEAQRVLRLLVFEHGPIEKDVVANGAVPILLSQMESGSISQRVHAASTLCRLAHSDHDIATPSLLE